MNISDASLFRLLAWMSPAFPTGAFSYSHGIEQAVELGLVSDKASLVGWITAAMRQGAGRVDAALLAAAWNAAARGDGAALADTIELSAAWRGSAELALESESQGAAFLAATRTAWPAPAIDRLTAETQTGRIMLPVAVGVAAAAHGIPLERILLGYLQAFAANLVSAGVRLIPLGQTAGQQALAAIEASVSDAVADALGTPLDQIGTAAPMIDICSMRHEIQYTRLFRS
ncbi:MAG TPA: urease accessory protein UreF [Candidatus Cybelea sp.]|nr:urease accessory protein UreF [Candidatus Cybelea sp.]